MTKTSRLKLRLVSSAGTALIAALAATGAAAQLVPAGTQINSNQADAAATGHDTELSHQSLVGVVEATVAGATGGISQTGTQSGTSDSVTENVVRAGATGNSLSHDIDLSFINSGEQDDPDAEPAEGAASLGLQQAIGAVTSLVDGNSLSIGHADFESGSVVNSDNSISANATGNQASSRIAGTVPNGYTSGAEGMSGILFEQTPAPATNILEASGTLVVTTAQQGAGGASSASAAENEMMLDLQAAGTNVVAAAPILDDNSISAAATGNSATGRIDIQPGGNPAFEGSAVVTNLQGNVSQSVTASTTDSRVRATVAASDSGVNTLAGGLSVQGNSVTSAAIGNESLGQPGGAAGNTITLGNGLAFTGAGTANPGADIAYDNGNLTQSVSADLVVSSSQANIEDSVVSAVTASTEIRSDVQAVAGGQVTVAGNEVGSDAAGNRASSALSSGTGASQFHGSVAVANQQTNHGVNTDATVSSTLIASVSGEDGGLTHDASISVDANAVSASATGNSSSQSVSLSANSVDTGGGYVSLTGGTGPDGNIVSEGGATVTNLQSLYTSSVAATNANILVGIDADSRGAAIPGNQILGTTLATSGNLVEAAASGSAASNSLALSGNEIATGAGVGNVQISNAASSVSATLAGSAVGVVASTHANGSTLDVIENRQQVSASGARAANTLAVDGSSDLAIDTSTGAASTITLASAPLPFDADGATLPQIAAAFAIFNDQATQADVTATAGGIETGLDVEGNLLASNASNESNVTQASAYGNNGQNIATIGLGNVAVGTAGGGTPVVGSVANVQAAASDIEARIAGGDVFETFVEDNVDRSTVSTSSNRAQVAAYGNNASENLLAVAANNVDTDVDGATGVLSFATTLSANASFAVQNAQAASGSITASQLDDDVDPASAVGILTAVGGSVSNATIRSDANRQTAGALGNAAVNGIDIEANGFTSSAALQNYQSSSADLAARIGLAGGTVTSTDPFNYLITGINLVHDSESDSLTAGTLQIDAGTLTSDEIAVLTGEGWTLSEGFLVMSAVGYSATPLEYANLITDGLSGSGLVTTTADLPNDGGVIVAIGDGVDDAIAGSTVSVAGNLVAGSVIGNSASNSIVVSANDVAVGSGLDGAAAGYLGLDLLDEELVGAEADHALSNLQVVSASAESRVFGAFAIDAVEGAAIEGSTLGVDGNVQNSTAAGNTASNAIDIDANAVAAGSALASRQSGSADIEAASQVQIFVPAAVSGSTVSVNGNENSSLAVMNDIANSLSVDAGAIAPVDGAGFAFLHGPTVGEGTATGDHALSNLQTSNGFVTAESATTIFNEDREQAAGLGLSGSSLTIAGNVTSAEATANRAGNSLALNGGALQSASAGLLNEQASSSEVLAQAASSATVQLGGSVDGAAAVDSSIAVSGNSTTALARGNSALNALSLTSGASYGNPAETGAGAASDGAPVVAAQAALLNQQQNVGPVTAVSRTVTHQVALNSVAGEAGVWGSTVNVGGNSVAAAAYGNRAVNSVTVAALNTGTPTAAVGNYQLNSGTISATAASVGFGISAGPGATSAGTLGVSGNQVTATAVGNSVTSTIGSAR